MQTDYKMLYAAFGQDISKGLRRLDSMTEIENAEFYFTKEFQLATPVHQIGSMHWTAKSFKWLLDNHFDIFDLIDSGAAIDAATPTKKIKPMIKKIIYETQWVARDKEKEYPHGWGFEPPLVEFPQDADPAWCGQICRQKFSNEEFECYGAVPRLLIDGYG